MSVYQAQSASGQFGKLWQPTERLKCQEYQELPAKAAADFYVLKEMCSQHLHKYPVSLQPNKTNAVDCEDYRTICLISHTYRILFSIIQEIIHNKNKSEVAEEQYGFGKNSGTKEAIFCLIIT